SIAAAAIPGGSQVARASRRSRRRAETSALFLRVSGVRRRNARAASGMRRTLAWGVTHFAALFRRLSSASRFRPCRPPHCAAARQIVGRHVAKGRRGAGGRSKALNLGRHTEYAVLPGLNRAPALRGVDGIRELPVAPNRRAEGPPHGAASTGVTMTTPLLRGR